MSIYIYTSIHTIVYMSLYYIFSLSLSLSVAISISLSLSLSLSRPPCHAFVAIWAQSHAPFRFVFRRLHQPDLIARCRIGWTSGPSSPVGSFTFRRSRMRGGGNAPCENSSKLVEPKCPSARSRNTGSSFAGYRPTSRMTARPGWSALLP